MMRQRGFSLIEVLITMLIIMFGLLGLAGMQLMAINNTEIARYKNLATILASNMTAKIQTNTAYWSAAPSSITITGPATGPAITGGPPSYAGSCVDIVCTKDQMAYFDLNTWGAAIAGGLPSGAASIACVSTTSPPVCTITIRWTEKNIALTNPSGTESGPLANGTQNPNNNFQTLVSVPL